MLVILLTKVYATTLKKSIYTQKKFTLDTDDVNAAKLERGNDKLFKRSQDAKGRIANAIVRLTAKQSEKILSDNFFQKK